MLICPICHKEDSSIAESLYFTCPECKPKMEKLKVGDQYYNSMQRICKIRNINIEEGLVTIKPAIGYPRTLKYNDFKDYYRKV